MYIRCFHKPIGRLLVFCAILLVLPLRVLAADLETVTFSTHDTTLIAGQVFDVPFSYTPQDADLDQLEWKSSNMQIATVEQGRVTTKIEGSVYIFALNISGEPYDTLHIQVNFRSKGLAGDNLLYSIDYDFRLVFWAGNYGSTRDELGPGYTLQMNDFGTLDDLSQPAAPWAVDGFSGMISEIDLYSVDYIGNNAFRDMTSLRYVDLYANSLGDSVFLGSENIAALEVHSATVPSITATSLELNHQTGKQIDLVFVQEPADVEAFRMDEMWGVDGRTIISKNGEWNSAQWEIVPSAEDGSVTLSLDYTPVDPADPNDLLSIEDMDTMLVSPPWHNLREQVEDILISDRVSYIGRQAFASLTNVQRIKFTQSSHALDSMHIEAFAQNISPWMFSLGDPQDGPIIPPKIIGWDGNPESLPQNFLDETVLYVPDSAFEYKGEMVRAIDLYRNDPFWSQFNRITDRTVDVDELTHQSVQMAWLPLENAEGYRLTIHKEGCETCDTTIFLPAYGEKGLIDWSKMNFPTYNAPRRKPKVDDGDGGMIVVIQVKKGSGDAPNQDVEVSASSLAPSAQYNYIREVVGKDKSVNSDLTKRGIFNTPQLPTYTVTFIAMNGTTIEAQEVTEGSTAVAPQAPQITGFHFLGWKTLGEDLLSKDVIDAMPVYADLTFTAQYEINTYKVTLEATNGTIEVSPAETDLDKVEHGTFLQLTAVPDEGYQLTGWSDDVEDNPRWISVTEDITVTALFAIQIFTVTFVAKDGTPIETQFVEWNKDAVAPEIPAVEGYHFTGWDKAFDHVKSNLTVTAQYEINTYKVALQATNGTIKVSPAETDLSAVEHGTTLQLTAVSDEGYELLSWSDKAETNPRELVVTKDTTITALFALKTFTVTFVDKEGATITTETVQYGKSATKPDESIIPEVEGYHFIGWDKTFDNVKSDLTVQAQYEINLYTVTFIGFAEATINFQHVTHGEAAIEPQLPFVYGYHFVKWDKPFDYITEDLVVTAIYEPNVYTVTFLDWDGTVLATDEVEHEQAATAPNDPEREGYLFTGWDKPFDSVTEDINVTALYKLKDPTGMEQLTTEQLPAFKVIENGVLYIIHKGTKYSLQGRKLE